MNVAQEYPARTDDNEVTWYRPAMSPGVKLSMWGWTSDPLFAHPDYDLEHTAPIGILHDPLNPKETLPMTELSKDGPDPYPRRSEYMGFPLPPFPEQVNVDMDGFQRYKLPSPTTGKLTAYTRMTTVSKATSDTFNLDQWKIREKVRATIECAEEHDLAVIGRIGTEIDHRKADAYEQYLKAMQEGKSRAVNAAIDLMHDLCGGAEAREHGGAVHDWLAELAMGRVLLHQIPEEYQVHARAYQDAMARAGLIDVPEWTERLVLNMRGPETIAGRLDGIAYSVVDRTYRLIDRKTSKTLDFSWLEYGIQFAGYGFSNLMLQHDRLGWDPMPKLAGVPHPSDHAEECTENSTDLYPGMICETCGAEADERTALAYCIHVPSDQPERSQVVPFNMMPGAESYMTALQVRAERRGAEKKIGGSAYPIPTEEALRYVAARQRLQNLQDADDAMAILEEYEDVMDDDLRQFGAQCFGLLNPDTDTEE